MKYINKTITTAVLLATSSVLMLTQCTNGPVSNYNAATLNTSKLAGDSREALAELYKSNPAARKVGAQAKSILVFPEITKGGLMVGGMGGNGALIDSDGRIRNFYQTGGISYGLQAGVQQYGYALFLMNDQAVRQLDSAGGWEVGGAPSLVVVDRGMAKSLATGNLDAGTYAFIFDQKGLMGGLGLQGVRINRLNTSR